MAENQTLVYETQDGATKFCIPFDGNTVWLTQDQIAELYGVEVSVTKRHIANIIDEGAVDANSAVSRMEVTRQNGDREFACIMGVFNLDMVLAVGDRIDPEQAAVFAQWVQRYRS